MTPSEECKAAGLDSLAELSRITGVQQRTLINWHKERQQLFVILLIGAVAYRDNVKQ